MCAPSIFTILLLIFIIILQNSSTLDEELESCKGAIDFKKMSKNFFCDAYLVSALQKLLEVMRKLNKYLAFKIETFKQYKEESCDLAKMAESSVYCPQQTIFSSCKEAVAKFGRGAYLIQPEYYELKPLMVFCELDASKGSPWTIIQRQMEPNEAISFEKQHYTESFGGLYHNYWLGLENIHALTTRHAFELWVQLFFNDNSQRYAKYSHFGLGSRAQNYSLLFLGSYAGDAEDTLRASVGYPFSTYFVQHEDALDCKTRTGGWWYGNGSCGYHLNSGPTEMNWGRKGYEEDLAMVHMAIREKPNSLNCN